MSWNVVFHPLVFSKDLPSLDKSDRTLIFKTIRKKLTVDPERYGEPLRKELFGYWKLRAGDFRVIYKIARETVTVLIMKIGFRRNSQVYTEMVNRVKSL